MLTLGKKLNFLKIKKLSRGLSRVVESRDPFRVLGIDRGASKKEIKKAYRNKAKECHPDLFPNDVKKLEEFRLVQESFEQIKSGNIPRQTNNYKKQEQNETSGESTSGSTFRNDWTTTGPTGKTGWDFEQSYRRTAEMRQEWNENRQETQKQTQTQTDNYSRFRKFNEKNENINDREYREKMAEKLRKQHQKIMLDYEDEYEAELRRQKRNKKRKKGETSDSGENFIGNYAWNGAWNFARKF
jgi:curved DNA-binding protein CbpA